jgi:lipopolysaccharide biosynthesis glycosyltransferase
MVLLSGQIQKHYPNGVLPFIVHFAGQKPWSDTYLKEKGNYSAEPDVIKAYFPYLEFVEKFLAKGV